MKNFEKYKKELLLWSVITVVLYTVAFGLPLLIITSVLFFGEASKKWLAKASAKVIITIAWSILFLPVVNLLGAITVIPRFVSYTTCPYCRRRIKPWVILKMDRFECPHCHNSRENAVRPAKYSWEI